MLLRWKMMMKTGGNGFLILFLLLPTFSYCRVVPQHRRGWGSKLDMREKAVQQFLKHNKVDSTMEELPEHGSGIYYNEHGEPEDSEPGDSSLDEEERELKLQKNERSDCVHPKTHHIIGIGSFDFDEKSCMMCECPSGKLKCYKTC